MVGALIICTLVVLIHYVCKEVICRVETLEEKREREERELQQKMMEDYKRNNVFEKDDEPFAGRYYKGGDMRRNTAKSNMSSSQ